MNAPFSTPIAPLALALLGGCSLVYSDDLSERQCTQQSDCTPYAEQLGTPLVCRSNACQAPFCSRASDCATGAACVQNLCVTPRMDGGTSTPTTCLQDSECASGSRCGFDGVCYAKWGCLDQPPDWPKPPTNFRLQLPVRNIIARDNPDAVGPLKVTACNAIDFSCGMPRVESARIAVNDAVIDVPFSAISEAFTGFVRIEPAIAGSDGGVIPDDAGVDRMLTTLVHYPPDSPLVGDFYAQNRLLTISSIVLQGLADLVKVPLHLDQGIVALQAYDCGGRAAEGVALIPTTENPDTTFVTVQNESTPDLSTGRTGVDGAGILINMPGGTYPTMIVRDLTAGRTLSDRVNFYVASNAINYLYYYPRYAAVKKWMDEAKRRGLTD